ncbi:pilus assembly protein [Comamonas testosteroni]|uniref:TadE/TadG family type IV pilus assembly protein n=1 Tax=Comamonas testosteroni TaxID=285 RepID=UPI00265F4632|nr:TadE family protein [Comamonas testosteroni]WKL13572.1 pilus assembly protein [Comamonas testosteroni]
MQLKQQQGAAAIEFAIVFPIFFLIFYAIITYGLIFAAQQTLTLAAAEGARAAVRYPSAPSGSAMTKPAQLQARLAAACATAALSTDWLSRMGTGLGSAGCSAGVSNAAGLHATPGLCGTGSASFTASNDASLVNCVTMQVNYNYASAPLIPRLLGSVLSLPTPSLLRGQAVAQISLLD